MLQQYNYSTITGGDPETIIHGPTDDTSFIFINSTLGPEGDYSSDYARILAPLYQNSNTDCHFKFYYYFSGDAGGAELVVCRLDEELDVPIDFIHTDAGDSDWKERTIGIGRVDGHIQVKQQGYNITG